MAFQRKQFAVIGLGRFGRSVCSTLHGLGHEVLGIDAQEENTRSAHTGEIATHVIQADATDPHALKEVGIQNFDTVVVAIGTNMEASILTTLNLLDMNVRNIIAKASDDKHGKVLERIGGDRIRVIYPERQMGERVAHSIGGTGIIESIELDPHYSIVELPAPAALIGKTLLEADMRQRYGATVIAIKGREKVNVAPLSHDRIEAGDIIAVIGPNNRLAELQK